MAQKRKEQKITVRVGRNGGRVNEYDLNGDEPTVGDALTKARIEASKSDRIRLNGDVTTSDTIVLEGDIITIGGKVDGGTR